MGACAQGGGSYKDLRYVLTAYVVASWRLTRCTLTDLSTTTIERNAELEARVTELELELAVWKQAHNNAVDLMNRDKDAHNARVAALNRQMNSLGIVKVGSMWRLFTVS